MTATLNATALTSILVVIGCGLVVAKETRYLSSATNRATQNQVRQQLGPPVTESTDKDGKPVWTYQVREAVLEGNDANIATKIMWCDDYILTFDPQGILRRWTHHSDRCS